jgi:ABC-type branched-subunit amino acid transport system ATPase component
VLEIDLFRPRYEENHIQTFPIYLDKGISILVVEQQATVAFKFTSYIHVMELGKTAVEGNPEDLVANEYVKKTYLGE